MTRRNLPQASLLELSGELGPKAQRQLAEHLNRSPAARAHYESLQAQMTLLRSLPKADLTPAEQQKISAAIKQRLHHALRDQQRQAAQTQRWKLVSSALAGALALAACLAIAGSIGRLLHNAATTRTAAVANAAQSLRDYIDTDTPNSTDLAYHNVDDQIKAEEDDPRTLSAEVPHNSMQKLVDDLDPNHRDAQTPTPGSL